MTRAGAAVAYWTTREAAARRAWRLAVHNRPATSPTRKRLYAAYAHAHAMLAERHAELAKAKPTHVPIVDATGVDAAGADWIAADEGVIRWAYNDSANNATAWIGHLLHRGPCTAADYRRWGTPERPAPLHEVVAYFRTDLKPYEQAVRDVFRGAKLEPTQHRVNGCVAFCFNIGIAGFKSSTTAREIRAGNLHAAADAMLMWKYPPEIMGRRRHDMALFLKP